MSMTVKPSVTVSDFGRSTGKTWTLKNLIYKVKFTYFHHFLLEKFHTFTSLIIFFLMKIPMASWVLASRKHTCGTFRFVVHVCCYSTWVVCCLQLKKKKKKTCNQIRDETKLIFGKQVPFPLVIPQMWSRHHFHPLDGSYSHPVLLYGVCFCCFSPIIDFLCFSYLLCLWPCHFLMSHYFFWK